MNRNFFHSFVSSLFSRLLPVQIKLRIDIFSNLLSVQFIMTLLDFSGGRVQSTEPKNAL